MQESFKSRTVESVLLCWGQGRSHHLHCCHCRCHGTGHLKLPKVVGCLLAAKPLHDGQYPAPAGMDWYGRYTELYRRFFHYHWSLVTGAGFCQQFFVPAKIAGFCAVLWQHHAHVEAIRDDSNEQEGESQSSAYTPDLPIKYNMLCSDRFLVWYVNQGMDIWYFRIHWFNLSQVHFQKSEGESFAGQILWMHVSAGRPRSQGTSVNNTTYYTMRVLKNIYRKVQVQYQPMVRWWLMFERDSHNQPRWSTMTNHWFNIYIYIYIPTCI